MFCCLFFNFAELFGFGCCSLSQEMSFVYYYLPCFRQWLITGSLSALLPFQPLFTEVQEEISSLPLPPSLVCLQSSCPLCYVLLFSSLFIIQFFFFLQGGSVCPGVYVGLSQGWLGKYCMKFGSHLLVCQMFPKQVWSWQLAAAASPPVFSV
jgi:hypothetical protein